MDLYSAVLFNLSQTCKLKYLYIIIFTNIILIRLKQFHRIRLHLFTIITSSHSQQLKLGIFGPLPSDMI